MAKVSGEERSGSPKFRTLLSVLLGSGVLLAGCRLPESPPPSASLHYLGHSAFVLTFGDTIRVLTDYGESNAYGLDSPVYGLGDLQPTGMTLSHSHADHAGGTRPEAPEAFVLSGEEILAAVSASGAGPSPFPVGNLTISAIPTHEGSPTGAPDNTSFLFEYRGLKLLHLGDCQGLMVALASAKDPEAREKALRQLRSLYPDRYDAVLLPIGFISDILEAAAEFATHLDASILIPMHFWTPDDRDRFLDLMEGRYDARGNRYVPASLSGPGLSLPDAEAEPGIVRVLGLSPGPWPEL